MRELLNRLSLTAGIQSAQRPALLCSRSEKVESVLIIATKAVMCVTAEIGPESDVPSSMSFVPETLKDRITDYLICLTCNLEP